jgi:NADH pyrophosphatase NudC (nudix superfamily)
MWRCTLAIATGRFSIGEKLPYSQSAASFSGKSYCLNPDDYKFCQSCGSQLPLKNRYYAIAFLAGGGFGFPKIF